MENEKVKAAKRALELLLKMIEWNSDRGKYFFDKDNPYTPEFDVCMELINS